MTTIIIASFLFSTVVILIYWFVFGQCFSYTNVTSDHSTKEPPGVTVIVAYKNAGINIFNLCEQILDQEYEKFELIAINDFSSDDGPELLKSIKNDKLKLLHAVTDGPGKKKALSEAIRNANYENLLFTDADCRPSSKLWIKSMATTLQKDTRYDIVLGYGPTTKTTGLLNLFARYETFLTAYQYMSFAYMKFPYMGVGRNLMYKKNLFDSINGYDKHENIASGDDDLFVKNAATSLNTAINLDQNSFMYSEAKSTFYSFLHQKSRHISTSVHYNFKHQILLTLFALSQISFWLSLSFGILFLGLSPWVLITIMVIKWVCQMFFHHKAMSILKENDLNKWFPLMDIMMFLYYIILPIVILFRRNSW